MLQQIGLIGTQARRSSRPVEDLEEEIDVEESLVSATVYIYAINFQFCVRSSRQTRKLMKDIQLHFQRQTIP